MKTIKLFSKVRWLVVTCLMLLTISPQMWGAGTAISSLNFNAPTSLPSNYTYSTTNTPDIQTFVSISCVQVSPSGNSNAPTTWSATDATAPSGGKRWIAFRPDVDCRVTLKVASNSKSKIFYLLDKDHKTTSSYVSSFTTTNSSQWYTDWSVSLTNSTWYAIMANASKCYIASMQFVANPTYSETAGTELTQNSGTVTLTSSGTTIYYKWSTSSSAYAANAGSSLVSAADGNGSSPKTVTAPDGTGTYYLYAVAKSGNYYSDVVKRNFTIVAAAPACSAGEPGTITKGSASGGTGSINLTTSGSPASGDTWYWQTSSTGTDKTHSSASAYPVSAAGTYYLRSYNSSGDCWNATSTSVTVAAADLLTPITPTLSYSSTVLVGSTISPTLSGNAGGGTVTYSLNSVSPSGSLTIISGTGVVTGVTSGGTATVTATIAAKGNYAGGSATSGTITVTANTLTYNANGGSGSMANTTGNGSVTLRTNTYTKSGCSFAGWATSQENANAGTVTYANGASYTLSADATLYAVWKVNTPAVDASTNVDVYGTTTLFITIPTDAEVRYTTNGDTPTPSSDLYDEDDGIEVTSGITVKAIAVRSNHITSDVLSVPFYNLSLGCENGTCSPASPYITKNHAYSITTDGTSGYAFRGWTIESGTGSFGSASTASTTFTMTSNGATIKAWWRLQCTITFNDASPSATGGEVGRTVYEGENTNLTTDVSIPSLTGATFAGYFTEEDGAGVQLVSETGEWITDVTGYIDADGKWAYDQSSVTLYAYWVVGTKTITGAVSPDGYGSISPAFISVTEGSTVSISGNVLTCDGKTLTASPASATSAWTYAFSSWSGVADDDEIADDVTATAVFTRTGKSYTITLDKEGGSGGSSNVSATYGSVMPSPGDAPTKDDYTFGGYYSAVGGGGTQYYTNACASAKNSDFTSASTLYAKWTQSISLDSEDGSSGSSSVTATYNSATLGSITNPTKTGYTFAGWYDGDDGTGNLVINTSGVLQANVSGYTGVGGVWTSSTAQTLYAKWNVNSYGVTYAGNGNTGGTVPTDGTSYDYGSDVTVAAGVPTKSGSTFVGWLNSVDNTIYRAGQSFSITDNTTLKAQWQGVSDTWGLWWFYNEDNRTTSGFGTNNITGMPNQGSSNSFSSVTWQGLTASYRSGNSTPSASITIPSGSTATLYYIGRGGSSRTVQLVQNSAVKYSFEPAGSDGATGSISNIAAGTYTLTSSGNINWSVVAIKFHTPSGYNVKFQNGSVSPASVSGMPANYVGVPSGKKIAAPATDPTAAGYIFGGWYTTSACSTSFDFDNTTISTDKTIYAKWTAKTQPTQYTLSGDSYYCPSGTATLTLSGSQSGISYQLLKGGSASGDPVAGTGSALEWEVDAAGTYTVKAVENATYSERTMSGSVTVDAAATTAISTQPTTSVSATASVNFTLGSDMVTAGHGLGYQWYSYTSSGGAGEAAVAGAQSATYTTSKSAGTYYYKVKVSGDCGDPVYSSMITVTVKIAPNVYSLSGEPTALCGGTATLTLSGSQSGLNYQLYKGGVAEGDPKSGTGNALTWTVSAAGTYTVKTVETSTYAEATMSSSAVITVYTITSITRQPYTTGTAYTTAKTRNWSYVNSIEATGSNLEYQWYYCNESGGEKSEITGQNSADLNFIFTNDRKGTQHICCVVSGECGEVQSSVVTITVYDYYYLTYRYNKGSGGSGSIVRPGVQNLKDETWAVQILQRTGYRCVGWNTDEYSGGTHYDFGAQFTMPEADVDLFAEWADAPQLKWNLNVKTAESSIGTSSKESNNAAINNTTDMSNLLNSGLTITSSAKDDLTSKIEAPASKDDAKYMYVTFDIPDDYEYIPTSVSVKAQPVGGTATLEFEMVDAAGHSLSETYTNVASGSIATKVMSNTSKVGFTETATLKIYCYGSGVNTYRLGTPITIDGYLMYICPERPTIVKPTSAMALNVYADESKTLSVEVETYNSGALTYQWKKDGANIAGANSATYTVVGSTLTVGTTYAYTCDVTEEGACASVTSPAFNVKTASPNCGYNEIANAVLTAKNSATTSNATALYQNMSNSSAPYKLDKTLPSYFGLQLSSGNFQVGDSIIFKVKINDMNISGYDDYPVAFYHSTDTSSYTPASALYIAGGQTKNTDNIYIRFVVSQAMIDAGLTNKILIIRSGRVTQNHSMYEARIKRYTCPDVVMFDANTDSNWGTTSNWVGATGRGAGLPTSDVRALITKPVTVNVTNAVAGEVVIDQHSSNTGKLIIPSTGVLNVEGPITKTTNGTSLSATDVADVIIDCSETSQGALIFEQPASGELQTQGTVNFYTKSSRVGGKLQWQYVGYPFISGYDYDYGGYYINKYSETQGGWIVMRDQGDRTINAWDGLAISGDGAGGASMTGTFVPTTGDKEFTLTYTAGKGKGKNLIGNSWTAPIQILEMEEEDFGGARAAIYVFNTGRYGSKEVSPSGSWVTLAIDAVKAGVDAGTWTNLTVIPAFQGFQVKTAATANKTLTLNYDKHVRPATDATAMNEPLRAPARRANSEINHMRLTVESDVAHQDVFLFEGPEFSEDFDNGWDGDYVGVSGQHAYLYVVSPKLGKMAIDAESSLEGRIVALQSAAEKEYTFTFAGNGMGYYLNDLKTQTSTLIEAGNSYTFTYEQGDDYNRFMISATPFAKTTPTGVEDGSLQKVDGVQKVLYKDHMYIIRGGRMFDATGAMVK